MDFFKPFLVHRIVFQKEPNDYMFGIGGVLKGEGGCKVCLNMLIQVFKLERCMLCLFSGSPSTSLASMVWNFAYYNSLEVLIEPNCLNHVTVKRLRCINFSLVIGNTSNQAKIPSTKILPCTRTWAKPGSCFALISQLLLGDLCFMSIPLNPCSTGGGQHRQICEFRQAETWSRQACCGFS